MQHPSTPHVKKVSPAVSPDESKVTVQDTWSENERDSTITIGSFANPVDEVQSKLLDVTRLPMQENGSPLLLDPCTQDMLDNIVNTLRGQRKPVPRMFVEKNKLFLEEYPISGNHERISESITGHVILYNQAISGMLNSPLELCGSRDNRLQHGTLQPDCQFEVETNPDRGCPNLVFEVAVSQTLEALHRKCCRYLNESDNIQIVVAVNVFQNMIANAHMVAFMYIRNQDGARVEAPVLAISFGTQPLPGILRQEVLHRTNVVAVTGYVEKENPLVPCDRPNIPAYQLRIDHRLLLAIDREAHVLAAEHENAPDLFIDLFLLQRTTR